MKRILLATIMFAASVGALMAQDGTPGVDMSDPYWTSQEYVQAYCQHRDAFYRDAVARGIEVNPSDVTLELWIMEDFTTLAGAVGMTVVGEQFIPTPNMCL